MEEKVLYSNIFIKSCCQLVKILQLLPPFQSLNLKMSHFSHRKFTRNNEQEVARKITSCVSRLLCRHGHQQMFTLSDWGPSQVCTDTKLRSSSCVLYRWAHFLNVKKIRVLCRFGPRTVLTNAELF